MNNINHDKIDKILNLLRSELDILVQRPVYLEKKSQVIEVKTAEVHLNNQLVEHVMTENSPHGFKSSQLYKFLRKIPFLVWIRAKMRRVLHIFRRCITVFWQETRILGSRVGRLLSCSRSPEQAMQNIECRSLIQNVYDAETLKRQSDFYLEFEKKFRGSLASVKERQQFYIPILTQHFNNKLNGLRALDIASGRGEWLDLLKERDMQVQGVEINPVFVNDCLKKGFQVIQADAFQFIKNQPSNYYSLVSCFHFVEHITLNELLELFFEVKRILRPGGMFIVETPNYENPRVFQVSFWLDPTHYRPLPENLLHFIFEHYCFGNIKSYFINPIMDKKELDNIERVRLISAERAYAQDYSTIGIKK